MRKIDKAYWQEIIDSPKAAKKALANLVTPQGPIKFVQLENGNQIPVKKVTEKQAHDFMCALCPDWAKE